MMLLLHETLMQLNAGTIQCGKDLIHIPQENLTLLIQLDMIVGPVK